MRRTVGERAAEREGYRRVAVVVQAVARSGTRIWLAVGRIRAVDVAALEERLAATVENAELKRLRRRHVLVIVAPPPHAALVFEEVIDRIQRAARSAADKDDVPPERLYPPLLVG